MIATLLLGLALYLMAGSAVCLAGAGIRMFRYAGALHGSAALVAFILSRVLA